jgi:hypothetical protein
MKSRISINHLDVFKNEATIFCPLARRHVMTASICLVKIKSLFFTFEDIFIVGKYSSAV